MLQRQITSSEFQAIIKYLNDKRLEELNDVNPIVDQLAQLAFEVYGLKRVLLSSRGGGKLPALKPDDFRIKYQRGKEQKPQKKLTPKEKQELETAKAMQAFAPLMKMARRREQ